MKNNILYALSIGVIGSICGYVLSSESNLNKYKKRERDYDTAQYLNSKGIPDPWLHVNSYNHCIHRGCDPEACITMVLGFSNKELII